MIGLAGLKDGAYTLDHPEGPVWLLVRRQKIIRAEQYLAELNRIAVWPADVVRQWVANVPLAAQDLREGVMLAD